MSGHEAIPSAPPRKQGARRIGAWIVLLCLVGGCVFLARSLYAARERDQGLRLLADEGLGQAEPLLLQTLSRSPEDSAVIQALARAYLDARRPEADAFLLRWSDLQPEAIEPLRLRVGLYRRENRPAEAYQIAVRVLEREPNNLPARQQAAICAFEAGAFAESERECRAYLAQSREQTPAVLLLLAEVLRARSDNQQAAIILDRLLDRSPNLSRAQMARAILFLDTGEPARAIPLLEQVIRSDPRRQRTGRYQLGIAYARAGRQKDADRILAEMKHLQESEVLRDALQSQPDNRELRVRMAEALLGAGKTEEALEMLQGVLQRFPHFAPAHLALARYHDQQGQAALAAEHRRLAATQP